MRTRQLAGQSISAVGSGDIHLATSASRGIPARDVEHALHEAIAFGITLFDVAADSDSEKLVGEAVRAQRARDRLTVVTRVPILAPRPGAPGRDTLRELLPTEYLQDRVEAILRASRLEVLSLVQLPLHPRWLASSAWAELVGTCARLVREGKVLAWAAGLDDPTDEAAPAVIAEPWIAALAVVYNLCDRRAEAVFAAADARKLPILAHTPLAGGALAGSLGPGVKLWPRDDRNDIAPDVLERIAVATARLTPLVKREPPAARSSETSRQVLEATARPDHVECDNLAELVLRFIIERAGSNGVALPRLHRREHLLPTIAASAAPPLSAALIARVLELAGPAPVPPQR